MSLSEALGPVVRHFYPIDPETSAQQQSLVYNPPSAPLVAPISSSSYPRSRELRGKQSKRIFEEDEQEVETLILDSTLRPHKRAKKEDTHSHEAVMDPIRLPPKIQRLQAYVEIPVPRSFDRSLYSPMTSHDHLTQGLDKRTPRSSFHLLSQTPAGASAFSPASDRSYDPDSDNGLSVQSLPKRKSRKKAKAGRAGNAQSVVFEEDDGTTCHQCRIKTAKVKMRCRNVRANSEVCTLFFCEKCISVRYDEEFDPEHVSWSCPRCRGMCNCSICLRKAGLGYVLDAVSDQFPGARGRLSGRVKDKGRDRGQQLEQISVRQWLARRGLLLGTDEWMETQRHRGTRYFVGSSPPPLSSPSPYQDAHLNPTLAACESEQEDLGGLLDPRLRGEGGILTGGVPHPINAGESAVLTSSTEGMETVQAQTSVDLGASFTTPDPRPPPITPPISVSQKISDTNLPDPYVDTEDLPGLTPEQSRRLRLIVGSPFPRRRRPKLYLSPIHIRRGLRNATTGAGPSQGKTSRGMKKRKKRSSELDDDTDSTLSSEEGPTPRLPAIHVRNEHALPSQNYEEKTEYKDEQPEADSSSAGSGSGPVDLFMKEALAPPPPPEPVFVPTEHYTPSKLDLTHVEDPDAIFGSSFWTVDAFGAESTTGPQSHVLLSSAGPDDVDLSPSHTGSTTVSTQQSFSTSATRTPGDHVARDKGYVAGGLWSFTALEETWIPGGLPAMSGDMPLLRMEGFLQDAE